MRSPLSVFEDSYFSMFGLGFSAIWLLLVIGFVVSLWRSPDRTSKRVVAVIILIAVGWCGPLATNYLYPYHIFDEQGCGHASAGWVPPGLFHHPSATELDRLGEHRRVVTAWIKPPDRPLDPAHGCIE